MISKYDVERREIGQGEVIVDVYTGDTFMEHNNLWCAFFEGDMDTETNDEIGLRAEHFPPGTFLKIEVPVCPKCDMIPEKKYEKSKVDMTDDGEEVWDYVWECSEECDMDWRKFSEDNYS